MKVCFIINGLYVGGAEVMLYNLLRHSQCLRNSLVVSLIPGGEMTRRIQEIGVEVETLGMTSGRPSFSALWRLVKLLRTHQFDIVSTWMYHADLLGGVAAKITGLPVVWGIHNNTLDGGKSKKITKIVVYICSILSFFVPDKIISCSSRSKDTHIKLGYSSKKIIVIPNGFDLDTYSPDINARRSVCRELNISEDMFLVGLVARFDPQKNHIGFLDAAKEIFLYKKNVHFILIGAGVTDENDILRSKIKNSEIEANIHLLGLRQDIDRFMASFDVLVMSSYGEAFPIVLGEAMSCGTLCVATDVGDSAFIIGDTGKIVPPEDMSGLAQSVLEILNFPPELKDVLKLKARDRIAKNFDIKNISILYEDLFKNIASSHVRHNRNSGKKF